MGTEALPDRLPELYREFNVEDNIVFIKFLLPPGGVTIANVVIVLNHGFIEGLTFDTFAPAYALPAMAAVGAGFIAGLRWIGESRRRAGEIALEIAEVEGRNSQDSKSEIVRARAVLAYKSAINKTAELEVYSENAIEVDSVDLMPAYPFVYKIKSAFDRFAGLMVKAKWVLERDFAENPFYSSGHRKELFESAVEVSLLEWTQIGNDPRRSRLERDHAVEMYLAIGRLRASLFNP